MLVDHGPLGYETTPGGVPEHESNRALLDYWETRRAPGAPLLRTQFDPLDVPDLLPGVFLAEPVERDFRMRLVGPDIEARLHRRMTGLTLMQVFGEDHGPRTVEAYRAASHGTQPQVLRGAYTNREVEHLHFEVLYLPIEFDNGARGILGGQFLLNAEGGPHG